MARNETRARLPSKEPTEGPQSCAGRLQENVPAFNSDAGQPVARRAIPTLNGLSVVDLY